MCNTIQKGKQTIEIIIEAISLLRAVYKLYAKIISRRTSVVSEPSLNEEQNGCGRGRSRMGSIF
jgi:hypothetical protein